MSFKHGRLLGFLCSIGLTVLTVVGCQSFRQFELQTASMLFSPEQETQLGTAFAEQIESEIPIVEDAEIQAWVDRVGQELLAHSPPTDLTFTFKVAENEQVNAFAIPGGFCYVNSGLIAIADNEAEVAAVIGHEINHVTRRHGMRAVQRQMGIGIVGDVLAGSADPATGTAIQLVQGAGGMMVQRNFGREDEREADFYGVEAMYEAGYDPRMAVSFFQKLRAGEKGEGSRFLQLIATHPTTNERIENIQKQIQNYDLSRPLIVNTPEFERVQQKVAQLQQ